MLAPTNSVRGPLVAKNAWYSLECLNQADLFPPILHPRSCSISDVARWLSNIVLSGRRRLANKIVAHLLRLSSIHYSRFTNIDIYWCNSVCNLTSSLTRPNKLQTTIVRSIVTEQYIPDTTPKSSQCQTQWITFPTVNEMDKTNCASLKGHFLEPCKPG